jgi:hypothetical protein
MAAEIEDGAGYLGTELDGLVGSPGGMPFSYLLAAWLSDAATPIAAEAADLMGEQVWEQAPAITYPTAVLLLFVADAETAISAAAVGEAAPADAYAVRALAQTGGGVCTTVVNFVNEVLNALFDLFKVDAGDGFFGFLGSIWNTAVDLVQDVVTGLVATITLPVVEAITTALFIIGTLSMVASIMKPWDLEVRPDNARTRFAVGDEPDISNAFTAKVKTGLPSWPDPITDCAQAAGLTLFDPGTAAGAEVKWGVVGLPEFGSATSAAAVIGDGGEARYDWLTGREESDEGEELEDIVGVGVSVTPTTIDALKAMVKGLISGVVPQLPFVPAAGDLFAGIIDPVFDQLTDLVRVRGGAYATVVFHDEPPMPLCVVGTWVSRNFVVPGDDPPLVGGAGVVVVIGDEGNVRWDFNEMAPLQADHGFGLVSEFVDRGTALGGYTVEEEDGQGTWVGGGDTSTMSSSLNGAPVPSPLMAIYVLMTAGSYRCGDTALRFSTADATGASVVVRFTRIED